MSLLALLPNLGGPDLIIILLIILVLFGAKKLPELARDMGSAIKEFQKAKDEFTFEYKATDISGVVIAQGVTKAKAKQDGEDVLTSQIKQASTITLGEIQRKTAR